MAVAQNRAVDVWMPWVLMAVLGGAFFAYQNTRQQNDALAQAVIMGDLERARGVVQRGADVNTRIDRNCCGNTQTLSLPVLGRAALDGNAALVRLLLARGADVNARDEKGRTALMYAAEAGRVEAAKALLAAPRPADLNLRDEEGRTALMRAARRSDSEVLRLLLGARGSAPLDLHVRDASGDTALALALRADHAESALLLRQAGARE